ncbi:MAG TPA: peptidyl-prolyl cis-trans isomerase, partial [Methylomirabilota bacterium]|nr:peptidyl-prolyl cis-trans isomerase [Methylomirabilota bacterium]
MLTFIRSHAASWVVRILFLILILSFAAWGIGDIFRLQGKGGPAVTVGAVEIGRDEVARQFDELIRQMQPLFNNRLDREQARQIGLLDRAVEQLVGDALLQQEARTLDVLATDDSIRRAIQTDPTFRGADGKFDRTRFERLIGSAGMTEQGYVDSLRRDLASGQLIGAVSSGAEVPPLLVETVYRHRNERRIGEAAVIATPAGAEIAPPEEAALREFYEKTKAQFQAPEYRAVTLVTLAAEALAKDIQIPEEELAAEYEARKEQLGQPERRDLVQVVASDQATAQRVQEQVQGGADLAAAASQAGAPAPVELGLVEKSALPGPVADAAFAAQQDAVTAPVQSPLGWHLVQVRKIEPGHQPTFAEAKDNLRHEMALNQAADRIADLANQFEDALAGGATLEEAAQQTGFAARKIAAVDAAGKDPNGAPVEGVTAQVAAATFETDAGAESPLSELEKGGYFMVRVDGITPAQPRPFEQVKEQVLSSWQNEERRHRAEESAKALAEKVRGGADFAAAATEAGAAIKVTQAVKRTDAAAEAGLPPQATARLFELKPGEVAVVPTDAGFAVLRLKEVVAAVPAADAEGMKSVEAELTRT